MTVARRLFHLCFAFWFTLVVTEPVPFHPCPMHDMAAPHVSAQRLLAEAASGAGDAAVHCDGGTQQTGHRHGGQQHQCGCLGCCSATASVTTPNFTVFFAVPVHPVRMAYALAVIESVAATPDFTLPPSTAPPATLA